jgi:RNA-directed DNA polymerase
VAFASHGVKDGEESLAKLESQLRESTSFTFERSSKADGRQRPLGIAALENKTVKQAVVTILNQIYEVDFKGFSYGFRPGPPHLT